jgi:hypothetical protein
MPSPKAKAAKPANAIARNVLEDAARAAQFAAVHVAPGSEPNETLVSFLDHKGPEHALDAAAQIIAKLAPGAGGRVRAFYADAGVTVVWHADGLSVTAAAVAEGVEA